MEEHNYLLDGESCQIDDENSEYNLSDIFEDESLEIENIYSQSLDNEVDKFSSSNMYDRNSDKSYPL